MYLNPEPSVQTSLATWKCDPGVYVVIRLIWSAAGSYWRLGWITHYGLALCWLW